VNIANKKFTSIKNDYCLTFDQNAEIQEVEDDRHIEKQGFAFTPIAHVQQLMQNQSIDVIGVVTTITPIASVQTKVG